MGMGLMGPYPCFTSQKGIGKQIYKVYLHLPPNVTPLGPGPWFDMAATVILYTTSGSRSRSIIEVFSTSMLITGSKYAGRSPIETA